MPQKILIIGPAWVGDMVMAQCLFKLLKQRDAHVIIDVLAPAWTFSLLQRMPEVSQAIEMPLTHGELNLKCRRQIAKSLRSRAYDQAIVLPNSFKSALVPWLARIPKRTGWRGECRYVVLNDIRHLEKKRYPLMIDQFMALGLPPAEPLPEQPPYPEFEVLPASQASVLEKHKPLWRGRPVLALCAGAEYGPSKRWPEEYYAQVANQKMAEGWDVWLLGSQKDRPVTEKIMQLTGNRCDNLAGRPDLAETIDLLSLVSGVVTNDSGLMHVAAALKKPLIALYGSTSPAFTPPLSRDATILQLKLDCQPCFERICPLDHYRCMRDLTPDRVLQAMTTWGG
ncbi:lipopolysaccharide heptosyltransferase II [Aquicella lusitana]|uniref:lipopolysaccharide heptosyltransferase II n=1 Tax=Aquicella lusitana TaxID=254246 RepID=A0A370GLS2_9COXI|nr:lipopolysaccharide heptosyltransferase II [Aquicella lusitana]RDI44597.1 heptosyltransferase-2 [Aquicella lusitana]VVC72461.1 ADP-heptose--LPS heptosyltransferase 2 [Aquicella lusitana]